MVLATPFTDIYDLFLIVIKDYTLDNLYNINVENFETKLQGFLILAIAEFDSCKTDISVYDTTTGEFTNTLSLKEQTILSKFMVIKWFEREVQNVTQFNNLLTSGDFKMYSQAQNLKEKSAYLDKLKEEISQDLTRYELKSVVDWDAWSLGDY